MTANKQYRLWGGTRRGALHVRMGQPNQDAYVLRAREDCAFMLVADGVGAAPLSHIGSHLLCLIASRMSVGCPCDFSMPELWLQRLQETWRERLPSCEHHLYSTTCRLMLATDEGVLLASIGDGGSIVVLHDGVICIGADKIASYANITESIVEPESRWVWRIFPKEVVQAVFLMSDGVYDDIMPGAHEKFAVEVDALFRAVSVSRAHCEILKILRQWGGCGDDKTIICCQRRCDR